MPDPREKKYTDDEIISALQDADEKVDGPLTGSEFQKMGGVSHSSVIRRFGNWSDAKRASGIETMGAHVTKAKYLSLSQKDKERKVKQVKSAVPCNRCGESYPPCAMDFHHSGDDKTGAVSQMVSYSWDRITEEMRKCIIVCATCHRILEHEGNI